MILGDLLGCLVWWVGVFGLDFVLVCLLALLCRCRFIRWWFCVWLRCILLVVALQ